MNPSRTITLATRKSKLALWQAKFVKQQLLAHHPQLDVQLIAQSTAGDNNPDVALANIGGKDLFAKELQTLVLNKKADIAVHSIKDLAAITLAGLQLAAICEREDPRDVFISKTYAHFKDLKPHAIVGTASPRRQSQLLYQRPDLSIKLLRGNVNTRLQKLEDGIYDAIILAAAGIKRLGMSDRITEYFNPQTMLPAIGQGAIGIECRADDDTLLPLLQCLNHETTHACVQAERAVNAHLHGNCFTPIAAFAQLNQSTLQLEARIGALDGNEMICAKSEGHPTDAKLIGTRVAESLLSKGAGRILQSH